MTVDLIDFQRDSTQANNLTLYPHKERRQNEALRNRPSIALVDGEPVESAIVYVTNITVTQDIQHCGTVSLPGLLSMTLEATGPFTMFKYTGKYALIPMEAHLLDGPTK